MIVFFEGGDGLIVDRNNVVSTPPLRGTAVRPAAILDHAARLLVLDRPLSGRIRTAARDAAVASVEDLLRAFDRKPSLFVYVFGEGFDAIVVRGGTVDVVAGEALRAMLRDARGMREQPAEESLERTCARLLEEAQQLSAVVMR